jgi:hypothetical protein
MSEEGDNRELSLNQNGVPPLPMPTQNMARVLNWLMKVGGMKSLKELEKRFGQEGFNLENEIKNLNGHVIIMGWSSRGGQKVVRLLDWAWATQWVLY